MLVLYEVCKGTYTAMVSQRNNLALKTITFMH